MAAIATTHRAETERDFPGVSVHPNADALTRDPGIGLAVISTPTDTHFEIARAALEAGKHMVIAKPMAVTAAEADELIALAQTYDLGAHLIDEALLYRPDLPSGYEASPRTVHDQMHDPGGI